ncbi:hypothetical protein CLOM_g7757 [Closterium sp. NIES-68]|nr:hypothetical protein CLOM_g7757 [Closterium sp. NIES-68]GJP86055.1 hypothetical protein CLOP_g16118 [Closterium sp. NIES-67]
MMALPAVPRAPGGGGALATRQAADDDDWLVPYIASTRYGADSKIQSQHAVDLAAAAAAAAAIPVPATSAAGGGQIQSAYRTAKAAGAGYDLSAIDGPRDSRRRSWAAPSVSPIVARRPGGGAAGAAAAVAVAAAAAAAVVAGGREDERNARVAAAAVSNGDATDSSVATIGASAGSAAAITPPLPQGRDAGGGRCVLATEAAEADSSVPLARGVVSAGGVRGDGGGSVVGRRLVPVAEGCAEAQQSREQLEAEAEFLMHASAARKSISGSGRRASLDYSDLEAVKERVQQAASLWALAEDREREDAAAAAILLQQELQRRQQEQQQHQQQQHHEPQEQQQQQKQPEKQEKQTHFRKKSVDVSASVAASAAAVMFPRDKSRRSNSSSKNCDTSNMSQGGSSGKVSLFRKWLSFGR